MQRDPSVQKEIIRNNQRFRKRQNGPQLGQTDIYNFDEFYRMHYGASIHNKQNIRDARESRAQEFRNMIFVKNFIRVTMFLMLLSGAVSAYRHDLV